MLLNKTARARDALQAGGSAGLSLQERRILILTDGKRTLNEVMALLGADILPAIDRLLRDGYIRDAGKPAPAATTTPAANGVAGAFTGLLRATTEAVQARTEQIRAGNPPAAVMPQAAAVPAAEAATPAATASAKPASPASAGQRRSLVAAKMYVVDMLQLQRHPDAVELKARIQFTSGQSELLAAILDGMRVLLQLTSESYGQRIVARLGDVLPEVLLPELDAAVAAFRAPIVAPERGSPPQLKVVGG
jgi:hypothetical protein